MKQNARYKMVAPTEPSTQNPSQPKQLELEQRLPDPAARARGIHIFAQRLEQPVHHVQQAVSEKIKTADHKPNQSRRSRR